MVSAHQRAWTTPISTYYLASCHCRSSQEAWFAIATSGSGCGTRGAGVAFHTSRSDTVMTLVW